MLKVSSSKKISFICGKCSSACFTSRATFSVERVRQARHKIDVRAGIQRLIGLDVSVRADESNLHARVGFLDFADELDVALKTNRGREKDQKFVVLADLDGLLPIDFVR